MILTLNAGSSSLKFSVYQTDLVPILSGNVIDLNLASAELEFEFHARIRKRRESFKVTPKTAFNLALERVLACVQAEGIAITCVGHRVVHGGEFSGPVRLNAHVLAQLNCLTPLAPLHQPYSLQEINSVARLLPTVKQVACFDTAFHRTMPQYRKCYALPFKYYQSGIQRYGFHGLSYQSIAAQIPTVLTSPQQYQKTIVLHLGSGASACALLDLQSQAVTMGFTALEGLPMATRCGQIDPGVVLYLLQHENLSVKQVEHLLYHDSGLLGLSNQGGQSLAAVLSGNNAHFHELTFDYFVDQIVAHIGHLAAMLQGLDCLVFTAGVGEHNAELRAAVCSKLNWLGVAIDSQANQAQQTVLSTVQSKVQVLKLHTDEEKVIAEQTLEVLS